jgi:hypothetical protein
MYRSSLGLKERELYYSIQNAKKGGVKTKELYIYWTYKKKLLLPLLKKNSRYSYER